MAKKTQTVVEQVADLSAPQITNNIIPATVPATRGRPKRKAVGIAVPVQQTCKECGKSYTANNITFDDGSTLITPPRCTICQTAHVTNGRVNKVITGFKHLGNIKARLTTAQRDAIVKVLANELKVLLDVYAGTSVSTGGFDLKSI